MNIQLISTRAIYVNLAPSDKKEDSESFSFDYQVDFPESSDSSFLVIIKSLLEEEDYSFETIYLAEFTTDVALDDHFKRSRFPYVNAPAIAYPFFRAFIANALVNCGLKPTYLPSVNFEKLYQKKSDDAKKES